MLSAAAAASGLKNDFDANLAKHSDYDDDDDDIGSRSFIGPVKIDRINCACTSLPLRMCV